MRHAEKPICFLRIATFDERATYPLVREPDLLLRLEHKCKTEHNTEPRCNHYGWVDARTRKPVGRRDIAYNLKANFDPKQVYFVGKTGLGRNYSYSRWRDRVIARLNRCPPEMIIALHSNLVSSIEL